MDVVIEDCNEPLTVLVVNGKTMNLLNLYCIHTYIMIKWCVICNNIIV